MRISIKTILVFLFITLLLPCHAQKRCEMSTLVRQLIDSQRVSSGKKRAIQEEDRRKICCFMKIEDGVDIDALMEETGGKCHARMEDLCIVTLPVRNLDMISTTKGIKRIEAKRSKNLSLNDISRTILQANACNDGASPLPHPFTGRGVVLGIMDIGFDLTHPNFLDRESNALRIRSLWDMLDVTSPLSGTVMPVGTVTEGEENLLAYAHSADGLEQWHGTHTLGTAAGSGYNSPYIGMAPDIDICCVANATEDNDNLIPDSLEYIYTYAMDVLGFKYLFDCADKMGKPCVTTFSEGSYQDLKGDDILYYEALEKLTGPGHIMVSSAGNESWKKDYIHKKPSDKIVGTGLLKWSAHEAEMPFMIDCSAPLDLKLVAYGDFGRGYMNDTITLRLDFPSKSSGETVGNGNEKEVRDTLETRFGSETYKIIYDSYRNCYDESRFVYDVTVVGETKIGYNFHVDLLLEDAGYNADAELFSYTGELISNDGGRRCDATTDKNILSPGSAPCVICVGATSYRTEIINYLGEKQTKYWGEHGKKSIYSSVGPTLDGRRKPDVMAPGTNVVSSSSSFFLENNPEGSAVTMDVEHFTYNGRTYAWHCDSGTSMSCPAAAGIIALWLEACPTMTPQDVLDVIAKTSRRPEADFSRSQQSFAEDNAASTAHFQQPSAEDNAASLPYPNNLYGYGEIDAYAGLMHILQFNRIAEVSRKPAKGFTLAMNGDALAVKMGSPSTAALPCRIYSTDGKLIQEFTIPAQTASFSVPFTARKGYYVVQIGKLGSGIFRF